RVLIITGGHDHEAAFYGLFDGYQDIGWPAVTDITLAVKQDIRPKYDVLVFYNFTRDLDDSGKKNLRDFVESGKGIVVLHHGILNFQKWPWWYEEVVGGLYRLESKGGIPNSTVKFGEQHLITAAGRHPITDGLTPFHITDETYKGLFIFHEHSTGHRSARDSNLLHARVDSHDGRPGRETSARVPCLVGHHTPSEVGD